MSAPIGRWAAGEAAQSVVETALLLPMLVFALIGGADMARAYAVQLAVQNGARAGAEATVLDFSPTPAEARAYALQEMARTPGMVPTDATVTMTKANGSGSACAATPDPANPCFITVNVRYTFHTIVPWPLIPSTFQLNRSTTMRTYL